MDETLDRLLVEFVDILTENGIGKRSDEYYLAAQEKHPELAHDITDLCFEAQVLYRANHGK